MRGDFYEVRYGAPGNEIVATVRATRVGGTVELTEPRSAETFLIVDEKNKAGESIRTARFAKGFVLSVIQGTSPIGRVKQQVK